MGLFLCAQGRKPSQRNVLHRFARSTSLIVGLFAIHSGFAQQKSDFAGDFAGALGPLHITLHIVVSPDGNVSATVDSPDQKLFALPCTDIVMNGQALSFSVPSTRGEWLGTLSADHTMLSGIWKQGRPMPLNLTRTGTPVTANNTPGGTPVAKASESPQHPPCTSFMSISYWDGSNWKPMTAASHMGGDRGVSFKQGLKNPLNPMAGITNILTFKNPAAALTLEARPAFCVGLSQQLDPTVIVIGTIDVKKGHRELETCTGRCASTVRRSVDDWMPEKRVQPVDIKRLSDTAVEITPKNPLPAGQYILGGPGVLFGYYDFGVGAGSSPQ